MSLNAAAASFERTFPTELQALKVLFQAGSSQSKGTLHWVCSTSDGAQLLSASAPCAASSSMSSPPTRTSQKLGRLTLTVDTNVRLAAGATIELWGVPA